MQTTVVENCAYNQIDNRPNQRVTLSVTWLLLASRTSKQSIQCSRWDVTCFSLSPVHIKPDPHPINSCCTLLLICPAQSSFFLSCALLLLPCFCRQCYSFCLFFDCVNESRSLNQLKRFYDANSCEAETPNVKFLEGFMFRTYVKQIVFCRNIWREMVSVCLENSQSWLISLEFLTNHTNDSIQWHSKCLIIWQATQTQAFCSHAFAFAWQNRNVKNVELFRVAQTKFPTYLYCDKRRGTEHSFDFW